MMKNDQILHELPAGCAEGSSFSAAGSSQLKLAKTEITKNYTNLHEITRNYQKLLEITSAPLVATMVSWQSRGACQLQAI